MMKLIYLGLGTNLGQRLANLQQAVDRLAVDMIITAVSPIYSTPPWGVTDQPDFFNCCVSARTNKSPLAVLALIKRIEKEIGRQETFRWGPRLIDIDLLFYDNIIYDEEVLTVPHPALIGRAFVLVPLADIAPNLVHPQSGISVRELLTAVATEEILPLPNIQISRPIAN
ncbi:MAG: 2-amino-4-hydroxy-6-hydroxymethyldihydropteridine diphosphokinase [Chloroflexi bacterium]|nr:2-amino-4-hydroxy-6-hydroxymethyldihydropteridine diphosphokinase [Chloroflexota bacterium]